MSIIWCLAWIIICNVQSNIFICIYIYINQLYFYWNISFDKLIGWMCNIKPIWWQTNKPDDVNVSMLSTEKSVKFSGRKNWLWKHALFETACDHVRHSWCVHTMFYMFRLDVYTPHFILTFSYHQNKILHIHNHQDFTTCQILVLATRYWIPLSLKRIRQMMLHICTRTRNKSVSNLTIRHQSMYNWIMLLILFLVNISGNLPDDFTKNDVGCYNAHSLINIWIYCKVSMIVNVLYLNVMSIRVLNQIGINDAMVSTAFALYTNSLFFTVKILCTQINDWQQCRNQFITMRQKSSSSELD